MIKKILWMFGPLVLVAVMGITTSGFPFKPLFGGAAIGAFNPANRDTVSGENTTHMLQIVESNTTADQPSISQSAYGPTAGGLYANDQHWNRYQGTVTSPTALLSGDFFGSLGGRGWDGGVSLSQSAVGEQALTTENWSATNHGTEWNWFITPSGGSITRANVLQLSGVVAVGNQVDVIDDATGQAGRSFLRFMDPIGGTRYGYAGKAANSDIDYESDSQVQLIANGGTDKLTINTSHVLSYNGNAIPRISYGHITQGAGTCTVSGAFQSSNFASCSAVSTGLSTITFTTAYTTSGPICQATIFGAGNNQTAITASGTTTVSVNAEVAGAVTNSQLHVICVGT